MKKHRFLVEADLTGDSLLIQDSHLINQWRRVLRLSPGKIVILFDGKGGEVSAEIDSWQGKDQVKVKIMDDYTLVDVNKNRKVTLYISILKKDNFDLAIQKATELGVDCLVPIISERTVKTGLVMARLEKIIKEATEQCGRLQLMGLEEPLIFSEAISVASKTADFVFFCHQEGGSDMEIGHSKNIAVFVGPEGGWTEIELKIAQENKAQVVSLSNNVLRAETAAIIASFYFVGTK